MDILIAMQRWLYGGMADGMRTTTDLTGLPTLMAMAFLFGIVHASMPGHGKSVLVSYHLGRPSRLIEGVATGTLLAFTHVGIAVVLVLAGVANISRSVAVGGRAPAFETASGGLIALVGLYLVVRTIWPPRHQHLRDGKMLAIVTGLVPCPLTTLILSFAVARGKLAIGLAAVGGMLAGVVVTLVTFAVAAVAARGRFVALLSRTELVRDRMGWGLEHCGSCSSPGSRDGDVDEAIVGVGRSICFDLSRHHSNQRTMLARVIARNLPSVGAYCSAALARPKRGWRRDVADARLQGTRCKGGIEDVVH